MALKKILVAADFSLRKISRKSGQVCLEYLLIFTMIATVTILSFSSFFTRVKTAGFKPGGFLRNAVERIIK